MPRTPMPVPVYVRETPSGSWERVQSVTIDYGPYGEVYVTIHPGIPDPLFLEEKVRQIYEEDVH